MGFFASDRITWILTFAHKSESFRGGVIGVTTVRPAHSRLPAKLLHLDAEAGSRCWTDAKFLFPSQLSH